MLGSLKRKTSTYYDREVKLTRKLTPARFTLHEVESPFISVRHIRGRLSFLPLFTKVILYFVSWITPAIKYDDKTKQ